MWLISRLCIEINDIVVYFQVMERVCGSFPGYVEIVRYISRLCTCRDNGTQVLVVSCFSTNP